MSKSKKKGQITMKKTWHSLKNRVTAMLLALICVLGLLPTAARGIATFVRRPLRKRFAQ